MKKEFRLTKAGVGELETELAELKQHRVDVAERLKIARDYGDLSENSEYHTAREEQVSLEGRIKEIEHILRHVELIEEPKKSDHVQLGNTVVVQINGKESTFTIVGSVEANPAENKISDESPIGAALLGTKVGERVEVKLPTGLQTFAVKTIK